MTKFVSSFPRVIQEARKEKHYTQSEVAEAISVTVRWYQKLESGRKLPGALTALRLILFLGIDVEVFREEAELVIPVRSSRQKVSFLS